METRKRLSESLVNLIKSEYFQSGLSLREIAEKYQVSKDALEKRCVREKWRVKESELDQIVVQNVQEKLQTNVDLFNKKLLSKAERYENLVLASQAQASTNSEGIAILDPDSLDTYSKVEGRVIDWQKVAYGITDNHSVDVTSGGLSMVQVMAKLQELSLGDKERVIDVEGLKEAAKELSEGQ